MVNKTKANFGVTIFPTDTTIQPMDVARAVEERGLDSLFFPEHTHIPTSRKTPFPGGTDLPDWYWRSHDPFVALTAAAAVTSKIKLGTGICLVTERDPITLAKACASLDVISEGRFIFGIGAGWNVEEMENHGTSYKTRWAILRERILAMKEIWTKDEAEFHGDHVNFDSLWSWPKPVQAGGPPIWLGANSKWAFDRVAEFCDGWMPIGGLGKGGMENLQNACDNRGRDVSDITIALFGAPLEMDAVAQKLEQGFTDLIFTLPQSEPTKVLQHLDKVADLVAKIR